MLSSRNRTLCVHTHTYTHSFSVWTRWVQPPGDLPAPLLCGRLAWRWADERHRTSYRRRSGLQQRQQEGERKEEEVPSPQRSEAERQHSTLQAGEKSLQQVSFLLWTKAESVPSRLSPTLNLCPFSVHLGFFSSSSSSSFRFCFRCRSAMSRVAQVMSKADRRKHDKFSNQFNYALNWPGQSRGLKEIWRTESCDCTSLVLQGQWVFFNCLNVCVNWFSIIVYYLIMQTVTEVVKCTVRNLSWI